MCKKLQKSCRDERLCATMKAHFDASNKEMKTHFEGLLTNVEHMVATHDVDIADLRIKFNKKNRAKHGSYNTIYENKRSERSHLQLPLTEIWIKKGTHIPRQEGPCVCGLSLE